jgi:AcrR family transcriptional regulator
MASNYDKILKATLELANEKSYHGTSIQMIADKINISKSTIFYHFKNKESIFLTLFEDAVLTGKNQARLILNDKNMTGKDKLKKWTHSYLDNIETAGDILKVYLRESRFISKESKVFFRENQRAYVNLIVKVIKQIQKEDEQAFKNLDPKTVAHSIIGMYNSVLNWFDYKDKTSTEELADMMCEMTSGSFQKSKTVPNKNLGLATELQTGSFPTKSISENVSKSLLI